MLTDFMIFISFAQQNEANVTGGNISSDSLASRSMYIDLHLIVPFRECEAIKKATHALSAEYRELGHLGVLPDLIRVYTSFNLVRSSFLPSYYRFASLIAMTRRRYRWQWYTAMPYFAH